MKEFQCKYCNKKFKTLQSLRQHENNKHSSQLRTTISKKPEKKTKKKRPIKFLVIIPIVILVYFIYLWISEPGTGEPGKYDDFAKCLTENGAVMYGTDWCHFCQNQKSLFGKSFSYINYKNCDYERQECNNAGVKGYPTWHINNTNYEGVQNLWKLAGLTGCSL